MSAAVALVDRAARVQRSPAALAVLGVVLSASVVGLVALVLFVFFGAFTAYVPIKAEIAGNGNSVVKGGQVVYDDVPVGTVASASTAAGHGRAVVSVHLVPSRAKEIPANVTASVKPVTIFGTEDLVLTAPAKPAAAHVRAGQVIAATSAAGGANLQGTVTSLDYILKALHPAQLDTALTAIATALTGQGKGLGRTLRSLDSYLSVQLPHFPLLEADLGLLAPVANQIAASAPQLVGSLSNMAVTSRTITSDAKQLHAALTDGAAVSNRLYALIEPTERPFEEILAAAGPFFRDVSQSPTELHQIVAGLSAWATSWSSAERNGPYLSFSASVPLANAQDLVFAALDPSAAAGPHGDSALALGAGHVDPTPYTSRLTPATDASVRIDPAIVTPAEEAHAAELVSDLSRQRRVSAPAVASLLLTPLLDGLVVQT